ncbi:uncharacterized protein BKA55DRAFT_17874 [Fusarium redolens]|uniref:Uncharacterized protein n=1 Tax=Fusarium redolens TaxID=48865 RepID=A0A9P9R8V7_FUSRE|nr:uncharacterized protein BKA55DRAFT_17874 [Fusarium redolens]KAH7269633.1 hypothetical protein BKA55DRAFT_17874 [Fusarium redolens]
MSIKCPIIEAPEARSTPRTKDDNGSWLSADGPYLTYIEQSCSRQPNLELPDGRNRAIMLCDRQHVRATVLELNSEGKMLSPTEFPHVTQLRSHFSQLRKLRQDGQSRQMIYLVEGLNTEVIALLGDELKVDPMFFVTHERTSTYLRWPYEPNLAPCLPSLIDGNRSFTASYYDIRALGEEFGSFSVGCAESGRDALRTKLGKDWEPTVILHRKCSFWKTTFSDENDWSVLILCDPPFRKAHIWQKPQPKSETWSLKTIEFSAPPFQGGYADFIPSPWTVRSRTSGPSRECLYDDLLHYYTECYNDMSARQAALLDITVFMRKIIASHYMLLIEYHDALLSTMAFPLQRKDNFASVQTTSLEASWSNIQLLCSRLSRYIKDVSQIMLQLHIKFDDPVVPTDYAQWTESESDFQYIYMRLQSLRQRAEFLSESLTGVTGINGAARSIREAKTIKTFTIVALIFIPLSFSTSLFSMSERYLPGEKNFGVFFSVSLPLLVFIFAVILLFDLGYDENSSWTLKTFTTRIWRLLF